ncbi:hypothetical protein DITRI_Ditri09bG0112200 [Diplodiscus trichospermus]
MLTCNNLINGLVKSPSLHSIKLGLCGEGRMEEAVKLRDEMQNLKVGRGNEGERDGAECGYEQYFIKWYCKEGKMDKASERVRMREESGLPPDKVTFNTLIDGYCKVGNLSEALRMMDLMGRKGFKMDTITLNTLLHTLCEERKLKEASELLRSASKRGYLLDEASYGTLIAGYFKDGKADKALKLWTEMKKEIIPSIITYNTVIGGLCQLGKTEQAICKFNELLGSGLVPDGTTYNTIIYLYCKEGKVEKSFDSSLMSSPATFCFLVFAVRVFWKKPLSSSIAGIRKGEQLAKLLTTQ